MSNPTVDDITLFEAYLGNELDDNARKDFETRLEEDENFKLGFESFQKTINGLEGARVRSLIGEMHRTEISKAGSRSNQFYWISGLAASLVLIIGYLVFFQSSPSSEELFNRYFSPYPDVLSIRSSQENEWLPGMKFYTSGEYEKALEVLQEVEVSEDYRADIIFYTGVAQLASGKLNAAESSFKSIFDVESRFDEQLHWYLALTHLKKGDQSETKDLLNKIQEGSFKFEEAQSLLKQLDD